MRPGTYRLTRAVENPKPNARKYPQWTAAQSIPAGSVFSVEPYAVGRDDTLLQLRCHGFPSYGDWALETDKLFQVVAPFLEPVAESPSDLLFRKEWTLMGSGILDQLARVGLITTEQVEAAATAHLEAERLAYTKKA